MKLLFIERLYMGILMAIFIGIVLHAPLSVWLGSLAPDYELLIKSWKELLMLLAVPLALILVTRRKLWSELWRDWLFRLIIIFAALHLLTALVLWNGVQPTLAGLSIDLRWLLYFSLVYVAVRLKPASRQWFLKLGLIGALIVGVFALLQIFVLPHDILSSIGYDKDTTIAPYLTVDRNPEYVRINSTLRGPNPLGAYAVIVLGIVMAGCLVASKQLERYKLRALVVSAGMAAALWASYSRSALGAFVVTIGVIIAATIGRKLSRTWWVTATIVLCALVGGLVAARSSEFVSNVLLHENPTGGSIISSNEGHASSLVDGFTRMIRQPLGGGVGSTGSASLYDDQPLIIENQYLFIAHEVGWLGLVLFIAIFSLVLYRLWRHRQDYLALGLFASGVGLALVGLLQPVWVDDTVAIIWWGLAAIALGGQYGKKRTSH
jgi:hypothetical protein